MIKSLYDITMADSRVLVLIRGAVSLVEVVVSISIVALAVASAFLAFAAGLQVQENSRVRILTATLAMKISDDFLNISNKGEVTEGRSLMENPYSTGLRMRAERVFSLYQSGSSAVPGEISRRIDSENDEIAAHLRDGGHLSFLVAGSGRQTGGSSNAQAGFGEIGETRLPRETAKIVFAVIGYDQANSLYSHPILSWPYYTSYPAPPISYVRDQWHRHNWPGLTEFEDLWQYCTGTWDPAPPYYMQLPEPNLGELWDKANRFHFRGSTTYIESQFGGPTDMRDQIEILNDKTQALLAAVLPPSLLEDAPAMMVADINANVPLNAPHFRRLPIELPPIPDPDGLPGGWSGLTGDAAITTCPRPWQVLAISFAAWAALLRTSDQLDGSVATKASLDQELFFAELHRRCLMWVCRHASVQSTDWGAPRPFNRILAWDNPLLESDLFPLNIRSPAQLETWPPTWPISASWNVVTYRSSSGAPNARFPLTNPGSGRDSLAFMGTLTDLDRQYKIVSPVPAYDLMTAHSQATATNRATWMPSHMGMPQGVIGASGSFDCGSIRMNHLPEARRMVRDGDASGPGTLVDSWGTSSRSTLAAPFTAAERTRELVFWYVDWQSYEDFEYISAEVQDASASGTTSQGNIATTDESLDLTASSPPYWDPTKPECPGYKGPRDTNQNGVSGEVGSVPRQVRMRARTIARFPIYDPRLLTRMRH